MLKCGFLCLCALFVFRRLVEATKDAPFAPFDGYNANSDIASEERKEVAGRIVNGTKSILGQFPQQVSLRRRYSESHFCGGSILAPEWILTASHCMFDASGNALKPYSIIVVAGDVILKRIKNAHQWSVVKKIIIHPRFNPYSLHNDVTLLQLERPLTFNPLVSAAPLARTFMRSGTVCQVSGWGYEKHEANMVSQHLLHVDLPLLPVPLCRKLLWNISAVPEGMFCAGYREGGRDACQGDSGGGMLCRGRLTGVVSGGEGCAWRDRPGLYADLKVYLPWIEEYVDLHRNHPLESQPHKRFHGSNSALRLSPPLAKGFLPLASLLLLFIYYTVQSNSFIYIYI